MTKLISIIIPAYNAQKTIERCLNAVIRLDYPQDRLEIIVVDNNSTDNTAQIIKSFQRVTYLLEKNQGRSYARNAGAHIAHGELLAFIDADVFLDQNWLVSLVKLFEHPYIGGGQGRIIPCDDDGQKSLNDFRIRQQNDSTGGSNIILRLMYDESPMVNSAACMYRRDAFLFVGGFDVRLERHEDIDLSKRVFVAGYDLVAASQAIAFVEYHGEGWWSYFKRSFDEGTTKQSYNEKWTKYFFFMNQKEIELDNINSGFRKHFRFFENWRMNYNLIKYDIFFNFLRTIRYRDFYYFLKAINTSFRAAGRLCGKWRYGYDYPYEPRFHQEAIHQHIAMKDGSSVKLDHHLRFVMQDGQFLYAMNIKNNQFINFSESALLGEIIKHRSRVKS